MEWTDHGPNMDMPCDGDCKVIVQQRNGCLDRATAKEFGWTHRLNNDGKPWGGDIVRWCLDQ